MLESGSNERTQIISLDFSRNDLRQPLPRVARALDQFDGVANQNYSIYRCASATAMPTAPKCAMAVTSKAGASPFARRISAINSP